MPIHILILLGMFVLMSGYFLRIEKVANFLVSFLLVTIVSGFATYTPDWFGYELFFTTDDYIKEPLFRFIKIIIVSLGGNLYDLHLFYISIYSFIFVYIISKFTKNIFFVVILIYPILFIYYTTQIRYFLGYFLFCLALYKYYVDKKLTFGTVLGILGILSHYSVLLFVPILITNKITISKFAGRMVVFGIIIFIIYLFSAVFILKFLGLSNSYETYLFQSNSSSLLGGLFNFSLLLSIFYYNYRHLKQLMIKYSGLKSDVKFLFLYRLAYYPLVFSLITLITQEIGRRFILPAFLFHILLLIYVYTRVNRKDKFNVMKLILLFSISYWIYLYFFTQILGSSYIIDTALKIFQSNSKINL